MSDGPCVGIVQWFNQTKGYGFVRATNGPDLFFRWPSNGKDGGDAPFPTFEEGQRVEFTLDPSNPNRRNRRVNPPQLSRDFDFTFLPGAPPGEEGTRVPKIRSRPVLRSGVSSSELHVWAARVLLRPHQCL